MTTDDTTLAAALRDLAASVTDEPGRLALVHQRARRLRRRRHAAGAGVLAATLVAGLAGAEGLRGPGGGTRLATPAASPTAGFPSCPSGAGSSPGAAVAQEPAVGQQFAAGGVLAAAPGPASVTVDVDGGPFAGSRLTLGITPGTTVFVATADGAGETAATAGRLRDGQAVKFTATRTGPTSFTADQIHGAPAGTPTGVGGPVASADQRGAGPGRAGRGAIPPGQERGRRDDRRGGRRQGGRVRAGAAPATAPDGSQAFKAGGTVVAVTAGSLTVRVDRGIPSGTVAFALTPGVTCEPKVPRPGDQVVVAGTRTRGGTYQVDLVAVIQPATSPAAPAPAGPATR